MKSSGFDFYPDDSYPILDTTLQALFPKLFTWHWKAEPDDATTSSLLICMRPPHIGTSLYILMTDCPLVWTLLTLVSLQIPKLVSPTGHSFWVSFISSYFLSSMDANFLPMLVTCYPVPAVTLLGWKPWIPLAQDPVVNKDSDVNKLIMTPPALHSAPSPSPAPNDLCDLAMSGVKMRGNRI